MSMVSLVSLVSNSAKRNRTFAMPCHNSISSGGTIGRQRKGFDTIQVKCKYCRIYYTAIILPFLEKLGAKNAGFVYILQGVLKMRPYMYIV